MHEITFVRPQSKFLKRLVDGETPEDRARSIMGWTLNKPVVSIACDGDEREQAWGSSSKSTAVRVFSGAEAASLRAYLDFKQDQFLAAFTGSAKHDGVTVKVKADSRWAICARVLSDVQTALRRGAKPSPEDPFEELPWVRIMSRFSTGNLFAQAVVIAQAALAAKPDFIREGHMVKQWSGKDTTGLKPALAEACQVKDLVPEKDRASVLRSSEEGDVLVNDLEASRLFQILRDTVQRHPAPVSPLMQELSRALEDFRVPDSGQVTVGQLKAQTAWMRGLMAVSEGIKYTPCKVCGFPAFYEKDPKEAEGRQEAGWLVGSLLGSGWQPGTTATATVPVPACMLCKVEKVHVEEGVKAYGKHPIRLFNLGNETIPAKLIRDLQFETWNSHVDLPEEEATGSPLAPLGEEKFGNLGNNLHSVKSAPNMTCLRNRLTYAYLTLTRAGYDVAFDLPEALHPRGIFGWTPTGDEEEELHKAKLRLAISHLPFHGYRYGDDSPFASKAAYQNVILTLPYSMVTWMFLDALHDLPRKPRLLKVVTNVLGINGDTPMFINGINILEDAALWTEAAYPTLTNQIFSNGGPVKAFSEAMDNMVQAAPEERLGVAMAAITRNLNDRMTTEQRQNVSDVVARLQVVLERYSQMAPPQLSKLRNLLAPMIKASFRHGIRYTSEQNSYCLKLRRRLNDPDPDATETSISSTPATV